MSGQGKTVCDSGKKVMNIKQVADYLGVHTSTIYKYAQRGTIPAFKIGSDWRFSAKHIDLWIDEKMNGAGKK
ncbi:MAG: helix-turn-helix domain-containing protein [Candidatus Omnitrophica bacterium]|nr:helix-turn-helix domain-containing protein [Candidatus Omnitrophota bacterium]MCK5179303.1 helix-turn-helix domain-containing protein [Candidatus Omnitrophota bacterium]